MTNLFARQGAGYVNDLRRSLGALIGISQGLICDRHLSNEEIAFLDAWLLENSAIATTWPGDVVHARIKSVVADGVVTEEERAYLIDTLSQVVGGGLEELAEKSHVTSLAFDNVQRVTFDGKRFCLTGNFVYAPRDVCESTIVRRGGVIGGVTKGLNYLVIGGLGSAEWKHGSFGAKIEKAMKYKRDGLPILVVHEDTWASSLE